MRAVALTAWGLLWVASLGLGIEAVVDPGEPDSLALRIFAVVWAVLVAWICPLVLRWIWSWPRNGGGR